MEINKTSITVGTATAVIISLFSGWFFLDTYFARAADVKKGQQQTVDSITALRLSIIRNELNEIEAKIQFGKATKYDLVRKEQLERLWDQLNK